MKILPEVALTYDDVLLVPQHSDVDSRRTLSTKSCLTKKLRYKCRLFLRIWMWSLKAKWRSQWRAKAGSELSIAL